MSPERSSGYNISVNYIEIVLVISITESVIKREEIKFNHLGGVGVLHLHRDQNSKA